MACIRRIHNDGCRTSIGFSLLETVLVIAIIAILTAVAVPRYAGASSHYRAELAARRICSDLNWAAARARSTGDKRVVIFDQSENSYSIVTEDEPQIDDNSLEDRVVNLGDRPYESSVTSAVFGDDGGVVFDAYGRPDSGGTVRVQNGRFAKTVVLNGVSGKAKVQ